MTRTRTGRAHLVTGGFPPGASAGHDHDYARLQVLGLLAEQEVPASVSGDFGDVEKWLPVSDLLITYVAGPYPDAAQCGAIHRWLEDGGRWLGLHGTSGGRAERVEGFRQRRTVKLDHHALLGSYFLTHPPIRRMRVDVGDGPAVLTRGLPASFEVEDEPYFIELQDPAASRLVLTADYGPEAVSPAIGTLYPSDTSLLRDGKRRALAYAREVGKGGVAYVALGHCHNPSARGPRADPADTTPLTFRGSWEASPFRTLLGNAITWGVGA